MQASQSLRGLGCGRSSAAIWKRGRVCRAQDRVAPLLLTLMLPLRDQKKMGCLARQMQAKGKRGSMERTKCLGLSARRQLQGAERHSPFDSTCTLATYNKPPILPFSNP
jgi:hypothetical protein